MPRERLMGYCDQEETFEEQLAALDVPVVKTKTTEVEWYKIDRSRAGQIGLKDKVSVTSTGVTLGGEVAKMFGNLFGDALIKVAVVKTKNNIDGRETVTFLLKPGKDGFKISRTKANSFRIGSKGISEWLFSKGIKKGRYSLKHVDSGWIAVACKDGGAK